MLNRTFGYLKKEKAVPCPPGKRYKVVNTLVRDGNNLSLKEVGRIDIVEQIQSYEDGVSLSKMIERFKRGDDSALNRCQAFYGDVSGYETDSQIVVNNNRSVISEIGKKKSDKSSASPAITGDEVSKNDNNVKEGDANV